MAVQSFLAYLSLERNYSQHTVKAYDKDISDFMDFCVEEYEIVNIEAIDYTIIRSWIVKLVNSNITNRSINRKIASLKAYYKFLPPGRQATTALSRIGFAALIESNAKCQLIEGQTKDYVFAAVMKSKPDKINHRYFLPSDKRLNSFNRFEIH